MGLGLQPPEPALLFPTGYVVRELRGVGSPARAVRENVDPRHSDPAADLHAVFELRVRFAGKADDDIRGEGRIRDALRDPVACGQKLLHVVSPAHGAENRVVAGLKRHMEVRAEPAGLRRHEVEQRFVDLVDFDGREPYAAEGGQGQKAFDEVGKSIVPAEMDSGEHDLAVSVVQEPLRFVHRIVQGAAGRAAAHVGDDAEGAVEVAAVFHLEKRARVPVESADAEGDGLADDRRRFRELGPIGLRGAAGNDDAGVGVPAPEFPDGSSCLGAGDLRHGAGVDDVRRRDLFGRDFAVPATNQVLAERLALVLVDLAAVRQDRECLRSHLLCVSLERKAWRVIGSDASLLLFPRSRL